MFIFIEENCKFKNLSFNLYKEFNLKHSNLQMNVYIYHAQKNILKENSNIFFKLQK